MCVFSWLQKVINRSHMCSPSCSAKVEIFAKFFFIQNNKPDVPNGRSIFLGISHCISFPIFYIRKSSKMSFIKIGCINYFLVVWLSSKTKQEKERTVFINTFEVVCFLRFVYKVKICERSCVSRNIAGGVIRVFYNSANFDWLIWE